MAQENSGKKTPLWAFTLTAALVILALGAIAFGQSPAHPSFGATCTCWQEGGCNEPDDPSRTACLKVGGKWTEDEPAHAPSPTDSQTRLAQLPSINDFGTAPAGESILVMGSVAAQDSVVWYHRPEGTGEVWTIKTPKGWVCAPTSMWPPNGDFYYSPSSLTIVCVKEAE